MSEHLTSPSQLLANASYENRHKSNEMFGLLEGPDAEKAAYAARPFMDVAVALHEFIAITDGESYASNEDLGLSDLVDYAELKARTAVESDVALNDQEALMLRGYQADLRARSASMSADAATDLYDISGSSNKQRMRDFTFMTDKRLDTLMRSSEGEDKSKYNRIYESLKARRDLLDADSEDMAMFMRKYTPGGAHIDAIADLMKTGAVSSESSRELAKDIRKNDQNAETDRFLAASYRLFTAHEAKNVGRDSNEDGSAPVQHESNLESGYKAMTDSEIAAAREMVAGMNGKSTTERVTIIPKDPKERQVFEREYFANPEHIIPNEQNMNVLGELISAYVEPIAVRLRDLQKERNDPGVRYPGNLRTFWFTGDTVTNTNPKDGKDKLLFEYLKREFKQPNMNYPDMVGLPMDKVAKMMGVDLHSKIADYDTVFSTPPRKPGYEQIYAILDAK